MVSADGRLQLIIVRATFNGGDLDSGGRLANALQRQIDATLAETGPTVTVGMAGDVIRGLAEQHGLVAGMTIATLLTLVAVLAALLLYFRSLAGVLALGWSLTVGALAAFAFTELTIGHLNIASAFLSSIVIGNGINFGIIYLGRYFEERREGHPVERSLEIARSGTMRATAAAALAAGTAYLSLAATPFRGFRDFGIIGGMGMACCWISAYTVLPAALALAERRGWIRVRPEPAAIGWFERALAEAPRSVLAVAALLFVASALGAWRYLTHQPLETNLRNMASTNADLDRRRRAHGQVRPGLRARHLRRLRAGRQPPRRGRAARAQAARRGRRKAGAPAALQPGDHARRPSPGRSTRQAGGPGRAPGAWSTASCDTPTRSAMPTGRRCRSPVPPKACARSATPTFRSSSPGRMSNGTARAGASSSPTPASASIPGTAAICGGSQPR